MRNHYDKLIFELSSPGKKAYRLPICDVPEQAVLPEHLRRKSELELPEVTEPEVIRHYTQLSMKTTDWTAVFIRWAPAQ